jgi:hypothetical protein
MLRSGLGLTCALLVGACGRSERIAGEGGGPGAGASGPSGAGGAIESGGSAGNSIDGSGRAGAAGSTAGAGMTSAGAGGGGGGSGDGGSGRGGAAGFSGSGGAGGGTGGGAGTTANGGSSGMSEVGGGAGAGCTVVNDPNGCLCFSDEDCKDGDRCRGADCATDKAGRCTKAPASGCFDNGDCPEAQTCVGGRLASCGSTQPDALGTCESSCTMDEPATCPTGYGCACESSNNPNVPPECVCHKQCGSPSDCTGTDSMCGCGPGVADGLCVSSCFCLCG